VATFGQPLGYVGGDPAAAARAGVTMGGAVTVRSSSRERVRGAVAAERSRERCHGYVGKVAGSRRGHAVAAIRWRLQKAVAGSRGCGPEVCLRRAVGQPPAAAGELNAHMGLGS